MSRTGYGNFQSISTSIIDRVENIISRVDLNDSIDVNRFETADIMKFDWIVVTRCTLEEEERETLRDLADGVSSPVR